MEDVMEKEILNFREMSFLAHCSTNGIQPTEELRAAHRAGAVCAAEYLRIKVMPLVELAERQKRGGLGRKEGRNVLNLWGLLS